MATMNGALLVYVLCYGEGGIGVVSKIIGWLFTINTCISKNRRIFREYQLKIFDGENTFNALVNLVNEFGFPLGTRSIQILCPFFGLILDGEFLDPVK